MKLFGLATSALLLLATPVLAVEYQGKTIDGRRLPARVFSQETGGVYDAQIEFKQDLATIYFSGGSELIIRLNQPSIADSGEIHGYGRLGQIPVTRWLGIGLRSDNGLTGGVAVGAGRLEDLWRIRLNPSDLNSALN